MEMEKVFIISMKDEIKCHKASSKRTIDAFNKLKDKGTSYALAILKLHEYHEAATLLAIQHYDEFIKITSTPDPSRPALGACGADADKSEAKIGA
jgi:hypothetical protein